MLADPATADLADKNPAGVTVGVTTVTLSSDLQAALVDAAREVLATIGRDALSARGSSPRARAEHLRSVAPKAMLEMAAKVADDLYHGSGALCVTGLPISDDEDLTTMCLLIFSAGLGVPMPNNRDGIFAWPIVAEQPKSSKDEAGNARDGNTGSHLIFHTDTCSFAGLLCTLPAIEGGSNLFVSIQTVHDRIGAERPDLLAELYKPVFEDRKGEEQTGAPPYAVNPVFARHNGDLLAHWSRTYTVSAYKRYPVPPLEPLHKEALLYLEKTIEKVATEVEFEGLAGKGDLVLMNNNKVFHNRTPFSGPRRLYRVWIENENYPALPHSFGYDADSTRWPD